LTIPSEEEIKRYNSHKERRFGKNILERKRGEGFTNPQRKAKNQ